MRRCLRGTSIMTAKTGSYRSLQKCIKKDGKSSVFPSVSGDFEAAHIFSHEEVTEGTERHFSRKSTLFNL